MTRGEEKITQLTEELLLSLSTATDPLGVPLLKEEMSTVWEEQKRHIKCIQDPSNLQLYTITGHIQKGAVHLPLLRCARGSTSLESFHLHLARFIPGTAANAVNFQAYLVDGIAHWNTSRGLWSTSGGRGATEDIQCPSEAEGMNTIHAKISCYNFRKLLQSMGQKCSRTSSRRHPIPVSCTAWSTCSSNRDKQCHYQTWALKLTRDLRRRA